MTMKTAKTLEEALKIIAEQNRVFQDFQERERELQLEIRRLQEQLALKRAREFMAKSEKSARLYKEQPFLFDLEDVQIKIENPCSSEMAEELIEEESTTDADKIAQEGNGASKKRPGRKSLSSHNNLPKRRVVIDLTDEEKICFECGTVMKKVREQTSERLVHVPSYEYIEVVVQNVYECPSCVSEEDKPVTKIAEEKRIIQRSIATPELLAHIFMGKYQRHTPYYCQEDAYNWQGVQISRQNMCNWQQKVYERLKPLESLLKKELNKGKLLLFDETPFEVLKVDESEVKAEYWNEGGYKKREDSYGQQKQCYVWCVLGGQEKHPVISYNFRWTRSGKNVLSFLEGFEGSVMQSDGYNGYDVAVTFWNERNPQHKITLCNCNVHARRYFADAVKATKSSIAKQGLKLYDAIFKADKSLREKFCQGQLSEDGFLEQRQKFVKPLFDKLHRWLSEKNEAGQILDSSKTKEAIHYCLNRWEQLTNFMQFSFVSPSTNDAERAIKSFVMTRKNALFAGSGIGAESACFLVTLIETAKANKVNPEDYLRCLFRQAPYAETVADWEKLLPWNIEISPFQLRGEWISSTT
ncbi:MAG: IS66 family transposase [Candidatus Treponema excrementipullorum]|nr:IS66 family transposase [Candidatus Treponema excrementipullorum]